MNKNQAKEQIAKLQEEMNKLSEIINKPEGRWRASSCEKYYYVDCEGDIHLTREEFSIEDRWKHNQRNYFKTEKEAGEHVIKLETIARFKDLADKSWNGEEIDWKDNKQSKWNIGYSMNYGGKILFDYAFVYMVQGNVYFKTEELLRQAVSEIGEDNIEKYILEI